MNEAAPLYLETSAVLRTVLEAGTTPDLEQRIAEARLLLTSRLSLVEAGRALLRVRARAELSESGLARVERQLDELWARCDIWELTRAVCDEAVRVAPTATLRSLDALHVATFALASRRIPNLQMVSVDRRVLAVVGTSLP